jgi:hypothetical protein
VSDLDHVEKIRKTRATKTRESPARQRTRGNAAVGRATSRTPAPLAKHHAFEFRIGTQVPASLARAAKEVAGDAPLAPTQLRRLQRVARDHGGVNDVQRMFLAGLLDADNVRKLSRTPINSDTTIDFSLQSIRAGMPRVKKLGRRAPPRGAGPDEKPASARVSRAAKPGDEDAPRTRLRSAEAYDLPLQATGNRTTRRLLARDPEDEIPGGRDLGESATIGREGESEEVGRVRVELEKQGYDRIYNKRQMSRYAGEIAEDTGTPKPFDRSFTDGRARPDMIAINTKERKVLVLDLTKESGTTIKLKRDDRRRLPNDAPSSEHVRLHFEKTLEDAKQVARRPPGGQGIDGFKIVAQERWWATGEYSREVDAGKIVEPAPSVLVAEAEERVARRAAKKAEKAKKDAERRAKKKPKGKPAAEKPTTAEPEAETPAKPAPAKPAPVEPAAETPAKPAPAKPAPAETPAKPAPAKPAAETPSKPAPAKPAPAKPAAETPAKPASKPRGSKPTASKPSASEPSASKPRASKPTASEPPTSEPAGGHGGGAIGHAANGAAAAVEAQAMKQLSKLAEEHPGDKDLVDTVDTINKIMDAKGFVESPGQFVVGKIKAEAIQGVFNRYSKSINNERQPFEEKVPDVRALHRDPLDTGVSLEEYEKNYDKALAALRVPDARKTLLYVVVLLGLDESTPKEEIERRIGIANQELAKLPGLAKYVEKYNDARDRYNFALAAVTNQLGLGGDEWAKRSAGLADELRLRAEALEAAARILNHAAQQLWESPLIMWAPVLVAAQDLETWAQGFEGLSKQLREFADMVERRKGDYDRELHRLEKEGHRVASQAVRAYIDLPR